MGISITKDMGTQAARASANTIIASSIPYANVSASSAIENWCDKIYWLCMDKLVIAPESRTILIWTSRITRKP